MYNTTGQVHREGVANEANTIALLNDLNLYSETVEKRGGTKLKEDAVAGNNKISIKRKKSITTVRLIGSTPQHTMLRWVIRLSTSYLT